MLRVVFLNLPSLDGIYELSVQGIAHHLLDKQIQQNPDFTFLCYAVTAIWCSYSITQESKIRVLLYLFVQEVMCNSLHTELINPT